MNPDAPMPPTPPRPEQNTQGPTPQAPQPPVASAAPQYAHPPLVQPTNGFAIAALVLGILGFLWIVPVLGSLLGIIFGVVALSQIKQGKGGGRGMAHAGLWLGVASLVLTSLLVAIVFAAVPTLQKSARDVSRKADLNALVAQVEAYHFEKGYYPAQLSDMPNYNSSSSYSGDSEATYVYVATPGGCVGTAEAIAANLSASKCTGYTLKVTLQNGTEYTKSNLITPEVDLNTVKTQLELQNN